MQQPSLPGFKTLKIDGKYLCIFHEKIIDFHKNMRKNLCCTIIDVRQ